MSDSNLYIHKPLTSPKPMKTLRQKPSISNRINAGTCRHGGTSHSHYSDPTLLSCMPKFGNHTNSWPNENCKWWFGPTVWDFLACYGDQNARGVPTWSVC
eukprot:6046353-Amphidinium_carterae.1